MLLFEVDLGNIIVLWLTTLLKSIRRHTIAHSLHRQLCRIQLVDIDFNSGRLPFHLIIILVVVLDDDFVVLINSWVVTAFYSLANFAR